MPVIHRRTIGWQCAAAVTAIVLVAACSNAKQQLGLTRQTPDEFMVVSYAPLSLPPDFQLRPPQPGAPRPQEGTTRDQAIATLTGDDSGGGGDKSAGERALLEGAGADDIDPTIRQQIEAETAAQIERDQAFVDRLVLWREREPYAVIVDPAKEAERLEENAAQGKPITEGDTPIIKRKKRGLLEGIF